MTQYRSNAIINVEQGVGSGIRVSDVGGESVDGVDGGGDGLPASPSAGMMLSHEEIQTARRSMHSALLAGVSAMEQ